MGNVGFMDEVVGLPGIGHARRPQGFIAQVDQAFTGLQADLTAVLLHFGGADVKEGDLPGTNGADGVAFHGHQPDMAANHVQD